MVGSSATIKRRNLLKVLMTIRDEIRSYIVREGMTVKSVYEALLARHGKEKVGSYQNFNQKLKAERLRYKDALEIAEVIGYEIVWQKKK
jgi:hypothetical protein